MRKQPTHEQILPDKSVYIVEHSSVKPVALLLVLSIEWEYRYLVGEEFQRNLKQQLEPFATYYYEASVTNSKQNIGMPSSKPGRVMALKREIVVLPAKVVLEYSQQAFVQMLRCRMLWWSGFFYFTAYLLHPRIVFKQFISMLREQLSNQISWKWMRTDWTDFGCVLQTDENCRDLCKRFIVGMN